MASDKAIGGDCQLASLPSNMGRVQQAAYTQQVSILKRKFLLPVRGDKSEEKEKKAMMAVGSGNAGNAA
jgi:hypothetical protein